MLSRFDHDSHNACSISGRQQRSTAEKVAEDAREGQTSTKFAILSTFSLNFNVKFLLIESFQDDAKTVSWQKNMLAVAQVPTNRIKSPKSGSVSKIWQSNMLLIHLHKPQVFFSCDHLLPWHQTAVAWFRVFRSGSGSRQLQVPHTSALWQFDAMLAKLVRTPTQGNSTLPTHIFCHVWNTRFLV